MTNSRIYGNFIINNAFQDLFKRDFFLIMPDLIPALPGDEFGNLMTIPARKISSDYKDSEPNLIGLLKGAFILLSDLLRKLSTPIKIDFYMFQAAAPVAPHPERSKRTKKLRRFLN